MERYPCTRFQNMIRHVIKQTSKHKEDDRLKSSKSPAETPSCQHQKNHFLSSYLFLDCGLILCFLTSTPIGLDGISFFSVLCAGMNILCKHVQMCVCVCALRHVRGHGNGDGQHEIWSPDQSSGNYELLLVTYVLLCVFDQEKCWIIIRNKCPDIAGCTSTGDARVQHGQFCYHLFPF